MKNRYQSPAFVQLIILLFVGLFMCQSTAISWDTLFSVDIFNQVAVTSPIEAEESEKESSKKEKKEKDSFLYSDTLAQFHNLASALVNKESASLPIPPDLDGWTWPPDFHAA